MRKTLTYTIAAVLGGMLAANAIASTVTYRMAIDGNFSTNQAPLLPGLHTLTVEAAVTDNELVAPGSGIFGGLFQSAFNLNTTGGTGPFTFRDVTGGFIGAANGRWDSAAFIPPFDTRNQGVTANGGGPTVIAETHAISPANFDAKFADVGANVFSTVASGQFLVGVNHPAALNLVVQNPFGGDIVVASFNGVGISGALPDVVNNATINFQLVQPNEDPNVTPDGGLRGWRSTRPDDFTQQFAFTDDQDSSLLWTIDSFTHNGLTPPVPLSYSIDANGLFTWDASGAQDGNTSVYSLVVRGTDSDGGSDTGSISITMPEPGTMVLAGMGLIAFVTSRRKLA